MPFYEQFGCYVLTRDADFRQMPGLMVLTEEKAWLDRILKEDRGTILVQIGGPIDERLSEHARFLYRVFVRSESCTDHSKRVIQADGDRLPIESDSVDAVLIMHELNSMTGLAEAQRVVKPNGKIIVFAWNCLGIWNFCRLLMRKKKFPNMEKCFSLSTLKQVLSELDCEINVQQTICFRPPFSDAARAKKWLFLEAVGQLCLPYSGGVMMIVATKNVPAMTPLYNVAYKEAQMGI